MVGDNPAVAGDGTEWASFVFSISYVYVSVSYTVRKHLAGKY